MGISVRFGVRPDAPPSSISEMPELMITDTPEEPKALTRIASRFFGELVLMPKV